MLCFYYILSGTFQTHNFLKHLSMKKITLLSLLAFMSAGAAAQEMLGIRPSNYGGLQTLSLNPALMINSRLETDINLISFGTTMENNFIYIPKDQLNFFGFGNIVDTYTDGEYSDEFDLSTKDETYDMAQQISFMGPSAMFSIKNKHVFAITTGLRSYTGAEGVQGHVAKYAVEGLGYNPLHGQTFHAQGFEFNTMSWIEYGFSYSTMLTQNEKGALAGGLSVKYLQGIGSGYVRNVDVYYNVLNESQAGENDTMAFSPGGEFSTGEYGNTDYNSFDEASGYNDFINGSGFGFDIGLTYDFLKDKGDWEYEMDGKKQADPTLNRYKVRLGLSVLDIGSIKFKDNSGTFLLETNDPSYYLNWSEDEFEDNNDFDTTFSNVFYGDPNQSRTGDSYSMALPTAISFQVDWNVKNKLYLNSSVMYGVKNSGPGIDRPTVISFTPRYESKIFEASLPISYIDYASNAMRVGLALRFASFYVGSDKIGVLMGLNDMYGLDFYAGLKFSIVKSRTPDRDNDKVSDRKDNCINVPGIWKFLGCPDRDLDDVPDSSDQCPDVKGLIALYGCPDRDSDGIIDMRDTCPDIPGIVEFNGCPDTDGDKIRDLDDECPTVAGLAIYNGCPDTDNDSIPDPKDQCPEIPGPLSNYGCPVKVVAPPVIELTVEEKEIISKVFENLQFETGKAVIKSSSFESLDALALLMNKRPSFKLYIEGHTDNVGSDASNLSLSDRRAKAAKDYLVKKGVDASRITSKGYGESKPVATNSTPEGRQKNRRVEFIVQ
jgi:outer membrane protein OmpA-like peptidoglycan-associated protein